MEDVLSLKDFDKGGMQARLAESLGENKNTSKARVPPKQYVIRETKNGRPRYWLVHMERDQNGKRRRVKDKYLGTRKPRGYKL